MCLRSANRKINEMKRKQQKEDETPVVDKPGVKAMMLGGYSRSRVCLTQRVISRICGSTGLHWNGSNDSRNGGREEKNQERDGTTNKSY